MNAIEIARRRAEALHAAAVAQGADPFDPYGFVLAEARRRDIEVTRVAPGDVRLHGGRALYDPGALAIVHEATGDPFLDAFLVAHELGHVELEGGEEGYVAVSPDPGRPAEASPVGLERVVDYGARERREVQMDLFAREFLLPRPVARRLHVGEGLTATEIAGRLGAGFPVVAAQLLDALLVPEIPPAPSRPREERALNEGQEAAARHRGTPYLLEAGPGTGKTHTLVARVGYLLAAGVDPSSIIVLTFSNKAAAELTERIAAKWPQAAGAIWIGTFHAFGLDVVRRFHDRLGLPPNPRLLDRAEAVELLEAEFPRLGLEHFRNLWDPTRELLDILAAISRAKDEMACPRRYLELAEAMRVAADDDGAREAAARSREVGIVYREYERLKAERKCVDFGDLVMLPARLCGSDPAVRDALRARHRHLLVDEYQDVNRASVELLRALAGSGENLWAVGDARQSVYRFRGASPFNMALFGDDFPGAATGRLLVNYRSRSEVTAAFGQFANVAMRASPPVAYEADRGAGGHRPEYREVSGGSEEAALVEAVEEMRAAGFAYRDQAIICAGNDRISRLAAGLEASGIPVLYLGSIFERPEVKDLLTLVSLLADGWGAGLFRSATMDGFEAGLPDVEAVLAPLRGTGGGPMAWLDGLAGSPAPGLRAAAALFEGASPEADPWDFLARVLLDRTRLAAGIAGSTSVQSRFRGIAVWQFMNFVRGQPLGHGPRAARLLERVRKLLQLSDERDLRQLPEAAQGMDAVRLMTIHGSKGLEFPVVHIPGLNQGSLPRHHGKSDGVPPPDGMVQGASGSGEDVARASHDEEQQSLFFVALSRARDRLLLYSMATKKGGVRWPGSRYLDDLGSTLSRRACHPRVVVPRPRDEEPVPIRPGVQLALTDSQVSLYEKCPRRFLYTHVLQTGGRRAETPFMRMHSAVQQVVDHAIAQGGAPDADALAAMLDSVWATHGPADHGYSAEYRAIALGLLSNLALALAGNAAGAAKLSLAVPGGEILVVLDDIRLLPSGGRSVRKVRTGHRYHRDGDDLLAAMLVLAAQRQPGPTKVELVHLADGTVTPVEMSQRVLDSRRAKLGEALDAMRQGRFPAKRSRDCPRCPSFFICGPVPAGEVPLKKISK